jgi:hypothetical protein
MRNLLLSAAAATALMSAVSFVPGEAQAMILGGSAGVRDATGAVSTIDRVGCWRPGWHGWGWYPYCGYYGGDRDWRWHRHGWGRGWDDDDWRWRHPHRWGGGWHRGHDWD